MKSGFTFLIVQKSLGRTSGNVWAIALLGAFFGVQILSLTIQGRGGNVRVSFTVDTPLPPRHCFPKVNDYNVSGSHVPPVYNHSNAHHPLELFVRKFFSLWNPLGGGAQHAGGTEHLVSACKHPPFPTHEMPSAILPNPSVYNISEIYTLRI